MQGGSWRTESMTSAQRGYGYKWQQVHLTFVCEHHAVRDVRERSPARDGHGGCSRNKQWEEVMGAYELMIWRI